MTAQPLQSSVLVLNRSFVPIHVTTVRRAFCLLCKAVAQVVDMQEGQLELYNFQSWQQVSEVRLRLSRRLWTCRRGSLSSTTSRAGSRSVR